ncbi:MAG TPA: hypothetical protein VD833_14770 [Vicinamibacterales bacterium]|nr:hypothetical protein [Vicinamibacterales bacterium]
MLVQDGLTGYLHEVPDPQLYEYDEVYDNLGSPVGLFPAIAAALPALAPALGKILPGVARAIAPAASNLIRSALPAVAGAAAGPAAGFVRQALPAVAGAAAPLAAGLVGSLAARPGYPPPPMGPLPVPAGWTRPPAPYAGLRPRRVYLRCGLWPGEPGLVPIFAANTPPPAVTPAPAVAVTTAAPARRVVRRRRW